ncbi:hypothetical protein NDU88_003371 [Pleurodeles waltl]|uniref:Uncharacterized protein n=1 Tax=Pleurodeles waltl TaxID=8319 RepID=A0AAV7T5L4_PLEWA|nr:hypothetical protein NDU88_003371 [Pleurodeles waltl]
MIAVMAGAPAKPGRRHECDFNTTVEPLDSDDIYLMTEVDELSSIAELSLAPVKKWTTVALQVKAIALDYGSEHEMAEHGWPAHLLLSQRL